MRSTLIALAVLLIGPAAFAQERGQAMGENDVVNMKRNAELMARVPIEKPIQGAPYSGDVIVSSSQTLADGNHISRQETSHVFRDGQGRTRREQSGAFTVAVAGERVSTRGSVVSIVDPVAGYSYSLDAEHKIAWRTPMGASQEVLAKVKASMAAGSEGGGQVVLTAEQKAAADKMKAELSAAETAAAKEGRDVKVNAVIAREGGGFIASAYTPDNAVLEHATIDGLAAEGHKTSETIPAGKIGNDLPITITSEEWRSTDLKVLLLTKHSDPRTGDSTYHLTNIVRAEPDPSLFVVPPDYTIKDTLIRRNNNE